MHEISAEFPFDKNFEKVLGSRIAYVDEGEGDPVLFLHGNPTSSYLWRNIIPYVTPRFRAIAPDLIGMGDSDKPDIAYRLEDHARYLWGLLEALDLQRCTIVAHDWGSVLGMQYAREFPDRVDAIALMEPIMPPSLPASSYESMGGNAAEIFRLLQSEGIGEAMIYESNFFVEKVLGELGVVRQMTEQEMEAYRAPFADKQARKPTLQWPREMPIAGKPADVAEVVRNNGEWFASADIPKLLFYADPGALLPVDAKDYLVDSVAGLVTIALGAGHHFVQEDHPHTIGASLASWLKEQRCRAN